MTRRLALISLIAAATLAGCANTTVADLKGEGGVETKLATKESPAAAYRIVVESARACLQKHNAVRIDTDFFPDVNRGSVGISMVVPGSLQIAMGQVDIFRATDEQSTVIVRHKRTPGGTGYSWVARSVKEWLSGNASYCSFDPMTS